MLGAGSGEVGVFAVPCGDDGLREGQHMGEGGGWNENEGFAAVAGVAERAWVGAAGGWRVISAEDHMVVGVGAYGPGAVGVVGCVVMGGVGMGWGVVMVEGLGSREGGTEDAGGGIGGHGVSVLWIGEFTLYARPLQ